MNIYQNNLKNYITKKAFKKSNFFYAKIDHETAVKFIRGRLARCIRKILNLIY